MMYPAHDVNSSTWNRDTCPCGGTINWEPGIDWAEDLGYCEECGAEYLAKMTRVCESVVQTEESK